MTAPPFSPVAARPVELSPGRLWALGGSIALDGRVSWAPPSARGYAPASCYLIAAPTGAVLIDTGLGVHAEAVVVQLRTLLGDGAPLSIVLTRTEMDCALNVAAIERRFAVEAVRYTGGITVPRLRPGTAGVRFAVDPGSALALEVAPGIELELISPRLRLLPTIWPYDRRSQTLFTSDAFGHLVARRSDEPVVADGREEVTAAAVRAHLLAKLGWLTEADTAPIADDLRAIFAARPIRAIAPTHGRVVVGEEAVARHARLLEAVVREVGR